MGCRLNFLMVTFAAQKLILCGQMVYLLVTCIPIVCGQSEQGQKQISKRKDSRNREGDD